MSAVGQAVGQQRDPPLDAAVAAGRDPVAGRSDDGNAQGRSLLGRCGDQRRLPRPGRNQERGFTRLAERTAAAPRSTSPTPVSTQNGSRRLLGQPAGSGAGPPGGGPGYSGQGGLAAETGMEVVQGADLAGAELVVVDRQVVPAAAGVLGTLLGQDLVERLLPRLDLLALGLGVGGGQHRLAD